MAVKLLSLILTMLCLSGCLGQNATGEIADPKQQESAAADTEVSASDAEESAEATDSGDTSESADSGDVTENEAVDQLYIVLYCNTETQHMFLERVKDGKQEEFEYNGGTYIRDRYRDSITVSQLQVGELVEISYTDKEVLTEVNVAGDTFLYDNVTSFSINPDINMLSVADSKYHYDEGLKVFSENGIISMNELSLNDTICIRGLDKEILTLVVTNGHGTVTLKNTDDFEGGMVIIGNVVAEKIKEDMVLEVPEGTHTLSVANDGYGGTREITVKRFQDLTVDLNTMKGEEPAYCMIQITVDPEDAKVTLNGEEVDCSQSMRLKYGVYRLAAEAEGYVSWSGSLVVSSRESALTIELDKESEDDTETDEDTESESAETDEDNGAESAETDEDSETEASGTDNDSESEAAKTE